MDSGISCAGQQRPRGADGASGVLTIDLSALRRNYRSLSQRIAPSRAAAVVKADAYGLGAERVSRTLYDEGCRDFFVAQFIEADALRPALPPDAQVYVLNGLQPGAEIACAKSGIVPVLNSLDQLTRWQTAARAMQRTLPAVLQFDTGMSRLGFPPQERASLAAVLKDAAEVEILFVMSHLACADETQSQQNDDQRGEMTRIAKEFRGLDVCLANSGGIFLDDAFHGVLARPGLALYGGQPTTGARQPIDPVVRLDVAVIQTRTVPPGTRIGYGGAQIAEDEMHLATIAAGYADGLPRSLSQRGAVYYKGIRLPIVGRVSMDSIIIDVTALPDGALQLGTLVEVLGPNQSLEDVARDAGTISYEILTRLGHRYHRQYC